MGGSYLLGIDIGTSSSKGVILTVNGEVKAVDQIEHGIQIPRPGWAEHDAERVWWGDFCKLTHRLTALANISASEIVGIGICGMCPDLLLIDRDGECIRPAILYGIDGRAERQIDEINHLFGKECIYELVGHDLSSQSIVPKILWLKQNEPSNFEKADKLLTASSYIVHKLTGECVIDYFTASAGGMLDICTSEWVIELLSALDIPARLLPRLGHSTEIAGHVTTNAANDLGLKVGTPVIIGTGDVSAEAVSAGVFAPGETILVYGSTMSYLQSLQRSVTHPDLFSGHYVMPNSWFIGGATAAAGALTKWFRDNFAPLETIIEQGSGTNAYSLLSKEAEKAVSPTGIVVLPYFSGARTPVNDEKARGMVVGLTLAHNRCDLYRAILEGIGYEIRHNFEVMAEAGVQPTTIVAVGGGTKSELWTQIVSDILGQQQRCVIQEVGAPLGAAYLAGLGVGCIPSTSYISQNLVRSGRIVQPSPEAKKSYDPFYKVYRECYEQTKHVIRQMP